MTTTAADSSGTPLQPTPNVTADVKVQDYLRIMDVVDAERKISQDVQRQLSLEQKVDAIKGIARTVEETCAEEGE